MSKKISGNPNLDREIQEELAKEKERKSRSVKRWNLLLFIAAIFLLLVVYVFDAPRHYRVSASAIVLIIAIVFSIGRRSLWK